MNAYTQQDLSVMQAWPLERKIQVTQAKIIEWYVHYKGKVAVSFSGGKDSTVLLDLARRAYPDIMAVFVNTGLEYPEIQSFVRTVPNVAWLRPEMPFMKVIEAYGYPVSQRRWRGGSITPEKAAHGHGCTSRGRTGTALTLNLRNGL